MSSVSSAVRPNRTPSPVCKTGGRGGGKAKKAEGAKKKKKKKKKPGLECSALGRSCVKNLFALLG